ncbi:hypothetical protein SBRY_90290 [Actinacidiphila bryophytorum]|uniref:Uncharacterized protein n=1 Tax=Actinacidiphila bryophytorum TaxID=1436133 RepID=A0A9W4H8Z4_9ACTN|nr:hypothetical protein SBRY_90290 [Actinacidiphila bryophytorum]
MDAAAGCPGGIEGEFHAFHAESGSCPDRCCAGGGPGHRDVRPGVRRDRTEDDRGYVQFDPGRHRVAGGDLVPDRGAALQVPRLRHRLPGGPEPRRVLLPGRLGLQRAVEQLLRHRHLQRERPQQLPHRPGPPDVRPGPGQGDGQPGRLHLGLVLRLLPLDHEPERLRQVRLLVVQDQDIRPRLPGRHQQLLGLGPFLTELRIVRPRAPSHPGSTRRHIRAGHGPHDGVRARPVAVLPYQRMPSLYGAPSASSMRLRGAFRWPRGRGTGGRPAGTRPICRGLAPLGRHGGAGLDEVAVRT